MTEPVNPIQGILKTDETQIWCKLITTIYLSHLNPESIRILHFFSLLLYVNWERSCHPVFTKCGEPWEVLSPCGEPWWVFEGTCIIIKKNSLNYFYKSTIISFRLIQVQDNNIWQYKCYDFIPVEVFCCPMLLLFFAISWLQHLLVGMLLTNLLI